jgi:glutaredoxin
MPAQITIYGRPDCHLCDEAEQRIADEAGGSGARIEVVNIEHDDQLHMELLELIPVIELNGERVSKLIEFRGDRFAQALREALIN